MLGDIETRNPDIAAWVAETKAAGRVVVRFPTGVLKGALASRLAVPDYTLGADMWDYRYAPSTIVFLDMQEPGGSLDIDGNTAQVLMTYSDSVKGAVKAVAQFALDTALDLAKEAASIPLVWVLVAGYAAFWVVTNPEQARTGYARGKAYAQRWRRR